MTDCKKEFPKTWFTRAKLSPKHHDDTLNFFHNGEHDIKNIATFDFSRSNS